MKKTNLMKLTTLLLSVFALNACMDCGNNPDYIKKGKGMANVIPMNNMYVFINADPVVEYTKIGICRNDLLDQMINASDDKKIGKALKGIFDVSKKNIQLQEVLNHMVDKAKNENNDAEGLIFKGNLSSCDVIKFK